MRPHKIMTRIKPTGTKAVAFLTLAVILALSAGCGKSEQAVAGPKMFASHEEASKAVYDAAKSGDSNTLLAIFGPDSKDLLFSGDAVQDQAGLSKFTASYDQMHRWGKLEDGMVLNVGADNYPFPFPLLKNASGQWYFDGASAKGEILARRIGGNELAAIDVLYAIADAQAEYYSEIHDGGTQQQYAQKFVSDEGKQNGLYWKPADNQPESPLGPLAAYATADGYTSKNFQPFHGYIYRMITKQATQAPGGAQDYIVNGNMTGGFAILAYPAEYRNSGVMSFLINQDGVVIQKDLGEKTADDAKTITEFHPDDTWKPVE
jgi:hypothetical protein